MSHQAEAQVGKPPHLEGAPERHREVAGVGELPQCYLRALRYPLI